MSDERQEEPVAEEVLRENLKSRNTWLRLLFMFLFALVFYIAELLLFAIALLQFLFKVATGNPNARLTEFGEQLGRFVYQIVRFLTFNSEDKPFPFAEWPGSPPAPD